MGEIRKINSVRVGGVATTAVTSTAAKDANDEEERGGVRANVTSYRGCDLFLLAVRTALQRELDGGCRGCC